MKEKLQMVVFVLVTGSILTAALIAVNYYTAPVIELNEQLTVRASVLDAIGIPYSPDELDSVFVENIETQQIGGQAFYVSGDEIVAFEFSGSGLWGPIDGVIAMDSDGERLWGISIIRQEETPGLGSRITEAAYLKQFAGKSAVRPLKSVQPGKAGAGNEIDAITGATMTSNAFVDIVNEQLSEGPALWGRK